MQTETVTRKKRKAPPTWRIFRTLGGTSTFIGVVAAPDHFTAVRNAIKEFEIVDPAYQRRLIAELREA